MSVYTTQLRWIVEYYQSQAKADRDDYRPAYSHVGLDRYPIFDETYRPKLNDKIIEHFYFREIGFETAEQFAFFMRRTLNEVMPYFNKLYESELVQFDPITNRSYSWTETYGREQAVRDTGSKTDGSTVTEHTDDDLTHGKRVQEDTTFGKTVDVDQTTTFGKTVNEDNETERDRTTTDTSTTTFGKVQDTTNGGRDTTMDGNTHERVITSDTPMNQISNSGVENLNYATEVVYTDRESVTATETVYGGTTELANSGSDSTSGGTTDDDLTKFNGTTSETGSEGVITDTTEGGTQREVEQASGTDARDIDTTKTTSGTSSSSGTSDLDESGSRTHNMVGYDGTAPADLLDRWRKTFLNIDLQVIASLETLFMGLWN